MSDLDIGNFIGDYLDDENEFDNEWFDFDYDAINFYTDDYVDPLSDDLMTYLYKWRTTTGGCP